MEPPSGVSVHLNERSGPAAIAVPAHRGDSMKEPPHTIRLVRLAGLVVLSLLVAATGVQAAQARLIDPSGTASRDAVRPAPDRGSDHPPSPGHRRVRAVAFQPPAPDRGSGRPAQGHRRIRAARGRRAGRLVRHIFNDYLDRRFGSRRRLADRRFGIDRAAGSVASSRARACCAAAPRRRAGDGAA